jgi:hypothetical protein
MHLEAADYEIAIHAHRAKRGATSWLILPEKDNSIGQRTLYSFDS